MFIHSLNKETLSALIVESQADNIPESYEATGSAAKKARRTYVVL